MSADVVKLVIFEASRLSHVSLADTANRQEVADLINKSDKELNASVTQDGILSIEGNPDKVLGYFGLESNARVVSRMPT